MKSHEIDYCIIGDDIQMVEVELDPQETVIAEAGTMVYMEDGIQFETKMEDGSQVNAYQKTHSGSCSIRTKCREGKPIYSGSVS